MIVKENSGWWIEVNQSKQRFALEGDDVDKLLQGMEPGSQVEVLGDWQTIGQD